ncbi:MAG: hypothetical protein KGI68_13995 [Alphaproteobacteria bacterium]|nr:hypothetical protein [Alphaproteobacteria bacterium]MDE1985929.1 hypothetical protein [Alphaproteobacteria bacterium]MDE2164115.1 hypothetical protein [Alphaproteobacteria bacterium]MDE2264876.1 hypothetical protein [Alphaproteobacteria bacterium]MDE2499295.1 hypothetical protein [Alphaproteobacteria bacterium]
MNIQKLLLTAAAAAILTSTGAGMAMADPGNHHDTMVRHDVRVDQRMDRRMDRRDDRRDVRHDRYWRDGYHGYVDTGIVYRNLRAHHYYRWDGAPYWVNGRYVVRSYDRFGHVVFVEVNPYTGGFIGVLRF